MWLWSGFYSTRNGAAQLVPISIKWLCFLLPSLFIAVVWTGREQKGFYLLLTTWSINLDWLQFIDRRTSHVDLLCALLYYLLYDCMHSGQPVLFKAGVYDKCFPLEYKFVHQHWGSESLFSLTPLDRIWQPGLLSVNVEYDRSATVPGPLCLSRLSGRPLLFIHICFTFFLLNN